MMIKSIVDAWDSKRDEIRASFEKQMPGSYQDIFERLCPFLGMVFKSSACSGDYQGEYVFLAAYNREWVVCVVYYGSCSHCDTFQAVMYGPENEKLDGVMTMALHMVQGVKEI